MEWLADPQIWIAFVTLTVLELVLGIDNVIFISILAGKLPPEQQVTARRVGLLGAMLTRILLLFSLAWISKLTTPLFSLADRHTTRPADTPGTRYEAKAVRAGRQPVWWVFLRT